jgi:hypothetical protein
MEECYLVCHNTFSHVEDNDALSCVLFFLRFIQDEIKIEQFSRPVHQLLYLSFSLFHLEMNRKKKQNARERIFILDVIKCIMEEKITLCHNRSNMNYTM